METQTYNIAVENEQFASIEATLATPKGLCDNFASALGQATAPGNLAMWLVYLLECLESETMAIDPAHPVAIEDTLSNLQDALTDRLDTGRW